MMLTILYSCEGCGLDKAKAFVRYRRDGEDIISFMEEVKLAVSDAHSLASLGCKHDRCDLMIPLASTNAGIGTKPKTDPK